MTLFKRLYLRHWGQLFFFSACVGIGAAFLFATGNILASVDRAVAGRARELLSADATVSSNRPFDLAAQDLFARLSSEGVRIEEAVSFSSMLLPDAGVPFLVGVKAVGPEYPFYGRLEVDPPGARSALVAGRGACLLDDAGARLRGVRVGDAVRLGRKSFRVAGLIKAEPDRSLTRLTLAPRVIISLDDLDATGLVRFGSRIRRRRLLALPDSEDPARAARRLAERIEEQLDDPYLSVRAFPDAEPTVRRVMKRLADFFVLVSLVTLLLGTVGMAASMALFLDGQTETVAVLRCLGLGPARIARLYHGLCLAVGLQGGALGAAGGWALSAAAIKLLPAYLGLTIPLSAGVSPGPLAEAFLASCLLSVGVPFAKIRALAALSPLEIFRERLTGIPPTPRATALVLVLGGIGVFVYTFLRSNSWSLAAGFGAGIAGAALAVSALTLGAVRGVDAAVSRLRRAPFALRHGLLQLTRRRARTMVFLFTLSAGFGLLGALDLVRTSLAREILLGKADDLPDLFLVDIQKAQLPAVRDLAGRFGRDAGRFSPLIRARLTHVSGKPILRADLKGMTVEERSRYRFLTREYNLTYKDTLQKSERVVEGRFWGPGETGPQVSLEKGFSERTGIAMGDLLRFDIQGRPVDAPVTSIRTIEWSSMRPNFFVVFPSAVLEKAPQNFVGSVTIRDPDRIAGFQRELGRLYPNVSVIDITKVFDNVSEMLGTLLDALKAVAWFCVAVGLLVLAGTLGLDHRERRVQAALFRALGSKRRWIVLADAVELTTTGILTFAIGGATAFGLGRFIAGRLELDFVSDPWTMAGTLAAAVVLPPAVGLAVNARTYGASVLETLRHEA